MKLKRILAIISVLTVVMSFLPNGAMMRVSADISMKERTLYDYEFFGKWEDGQWSYSPKLNYGAYPGLSAVEEAAKSGDYETAKYEYLMYYRNLPPRRERVEELANIPNINQTEMDLFFEGILTYGNTPIGSASFSNESGWVSYDVTNFVKSRLSNSNDTVSFCIMARNKEDSLISINARESEQNVAVLNVISNGVMYNFPVSADLTIKGGSHASENFGSEQELYVRDSGWPADDDAARAFFLFKMNGLDSLSRVTSAQLTVYGSTDSPSGQQETFLFKSEQTSWSEDTKTWENSGLYTFSWQNKFYEKFDWKRPVGNYPDWSICVHRYYFLGGLSAYYRQTGDEKYAREAIKFLQAYLSTNGAGQRLMPEEDRDAGLLIAVGMRMQAFPEILYRLINSPNMTPNIFSEIMKYVWDELDFLYQPEVFENTWTKDTNFGVEEITGQLFTLDAFPEFADKEKWMQRISDRVDYQLSTSQTPLIMADGSYIEATNSYAAAVYNRFLSFKEIFDNLNFPLSNSYEKQMRRMAYYFMNITEPNYYFTPYGDCPYMDQSVLLKKIADEVGRVYGDDYLMYLGNKREKGKSPTHTSAAYPNGQIFIQRSGWESDDLFLFTNTRTNAVHSHNDDLHINLYAYGQQLLTDNPVYNYDDNAANRWMRYRKQGHSTIEIDGDSGLYDIEANGTQISNKLSDLFYGYTKGAVPAQGCSTQHDRQIMFVKPGGFWIVSDLVNITGPNIGTHTITQQWQPQLNSDIGIESGSLSGRTHCTGSNIQITPADPEMLTATIEDGYYSLNSKKFLMYEKEVQGAGKATFDTVLFPIRKNDNTANATVERIDLEKPTDEATALRITTKSVAGEQTGYYYNSYQSAEQTQFDRFTTNAKTVYIQNDELGNPTIVNLYNGSYIGNGPDKLIEVPTCVSDVSVSVKDGVMEVSSSVDDEKAFIGTKIKARGIKKIYFNSRPITAYFDGAEVEIGKTMPNAKEAQISVCLSEQEFGVFASGNNLPAFGTPISKVIPVEASAARLYDGNLSTIWEADDSSYPQSVFFDFGEVKPLERMDIYWKIPTEGPAIGSFDYGISISNDGDNYTEITRQKSTDFITSTGLQVNARYLKITIYDNTVFEAAGIRDVVFHEYNGDSRSLSEGKSTTFSLGSGGSKLSDTVKIVIPDGGDLNIALLGKGCVTKLDNLTQLEAAAGNMSSDSVIAARDKNDLIVYTNCGGDFMLSDKPISLPVIPTVQPGNSKGNGGGGGRGNGNNYADIKKGDLPQPPDDDTSTVTKGSFTDINGHWAKEEILSAKERGLISGVTEKLFEPDRPITRAEFAVIAIRFMQLPLVKYRGEFIDIENTAWYADAVQTAADYQLMSGYGEGIFCPDAYITRQEAAVVIAGVTKNMEIRQDINVTFTDEDEIAVWSKDAVRNMTKQGIFKGDDNGCFRPRATITRAETAAIFNRTYSIYA